MCASQFSFAWDISGTVYCDSNGDEQADAGDTPLPSILVVVTNTSGTFSNANYTTTPEGAFVLEVPSVPDSYVEYLDPTSLPADATVVLPAGGLQLFSLDDNNQAFAGDFLIDSSTCGSTVTNPPPPPPSTNTCCVTGGGTICKGRGQPSFTFSVEAFPGDGTPEGDSGKLDIVAHTLKAHLKGDVFDIVNCGDTDSGCNYIEFSGAGTLTGIAGCKGSAGVVYFYARAEDCGEGKCAGDKMYVRVTDADGNVLLLISGDRADASDIVTVPISTGNIQIHQNCNATCNPGNKGGGDNSGCNNGEGGKGGKGGKGDNAGKGGKKNGGKCDNGKSGKGSG
ncbi:MAG TPA: hypothetical protein VHH88_06915, partial [Verrucomicrobiae bacterium]|nr:hypothetical protein [Verrucomicrobiae bacterium]